MCAHTQFVLRRDFRPSYNTASSNSSIWSAKLKIYEKLKLVNGKMIKFQAAYEINCPFITEDSQRCNCLPDKRVESVFWYISLKDHIFGVTLSSDGKMANIECEDVIDPYTFDSLTHIIFKYYSDQIKLYGWIEPIRTDFFCKDCISLNNYERNIAKTYRLMKEHEALDKHSNICSENASKIMTFLAKKAHVMIMNDK